MEVVKEILCGIAIGVANVAPGVSGGALLVSMGIYDEVIHAVTGIFGHMRDSIRLLLPYIIGMGIGIVGLSFVIEYLFGIYPIQTSMLFVGLIYGGMPFLLPKVWQKAPSAAEVCICILSFVLVICTELQSEGMARVLSTEPKMLLMLFGVGVLAAAAMVIPGVSGSMLLLAMGFYTPILAHINAFAAACLALDFKMIWYCVQPLVPFGCGLVLGIFSIAKLIEYLLCRYERMTYFAILGLLLSSPAAVFSEIRGQSADGWTLTVGFLLFLLGAAAAILLGKTSN